MKIEEAIIEYGRTSLTVENDWYQWRNINPRYLPQGILLPVGNQYTQNASLKTQLCQQYINGNDDTKISITRYYIAIWGGVKRNSVDKINNYALNTPDNLISKGSQGIASWSKALCVRNPNEYAIYDARVALSLNSIQAAFEVENPRLYPLLVGQNKTINKGSMHVCEHACKNSWPKVEEESFYRQYNEILSVAANALNVSHYTLEMLLFSHAKNLLHSVFPSEQL